MELGVSTHPTNPTIDEIFQIAGVRYGVDWKLIKAVATVESKLYPDAIGDRKKSIGLMQVHVALAYQYKITRRMLMNPYINIHMGAYQLSYLIKRYGLRKGLQMYNLGETKYFKGKRRAMGYYKRVMREYK